MHKQQSNRTREMTNQVYRYLNNGYEMPALGLGTYGCAPGVLNNVVKAAIDVGYRHIDTAWIYDNEKDIGSAIREKIADGTVQRKDLFVTTKLWNNWHHPRSVLPMLSESLKNLGLDYVDLFVMHWPMAFKEDGNKYYVTNENFIDLDFVQTWRAMEQCVDRRLTRSIGIGNFNSDQVKRLMDNCRIKPVTNYAEVNPYMNQKNLINYCRYYDIVVTGYCPMACNELEHVKGFPEPTISDPHVASVGNRNYGKTSNQVVLNYLIYELGVTVTPKTIHPFRLKENFDYVDFRLRPEDIRYLDSLNKNIRTCPYWSYVEHPEYPFHLKF